MRKGCMESDGVEAFIWPTLKLSRWMRFYVFIAV